MQTRREFLALPLAAILAQKADSAPDDSQGEWRNRQPGMAYRRLGRTRFHISEIVMGGNTISPDNYEHVVAAIDRGLNYLDTAPAYGKGKSEEGYGRVLKSRARDKVFLNTKVSLWDINRNALFQSIYDGLPGGEQDRLRTKARDYIEERKSDHPEYFVNYFGDQRNELDQAALSAVMEQEYGRRIDR